MARAALPGRLTWHTATVIDTIPLTARARTLVLDVPGWPGHRAGQHLDLRLTAEDGYQARRSYSVASAPEDPRLELTVERLPDGEVSPYLVDEVRRGDVLEVRGPIGGYFVWDAGRGVGDGSPVLLVAGGSGVVPLRAMLRHHRAAGSRVPMRLLYSARRIDDLLYRDELLAADLDVRVTLTRGVPDGWTGYRGRVDATMLADASWPGERPDVFVCGPTGLVEAVAATLVRLGHDPARVRTERFGPTGS